MYKFLGNKNNLIAITLLTLLVVFLSSPFLALADASVDGFFPKNFVTEGFFKDGTFETVSRSKLPKPQPIHANNMPIRQQDDRCRQLLNSSNDTFAIPVNWTNCNTHQYNQ